jgi:ATP-dependent exoDNAse (exonuclease V) beta subunit
MLNLKRVGLMDEIILPLKNSHAELPFVLEKGINIFKGRIDRVIIKPDNASIYDYKTFPVRNGELPELIEKYGSQMGLYKEAAEKLFDLRTRSYLLFTNLPRLVEV